jgi:hypothetical protein
MQGQPASTVTYCPYNGQTLCALCICLSHRDCAIVADAVAIRNPVLSPALVMDYSRGRIDTQGNASERVLCLPATLFADMLDHMRDGRETFADRLVDPMVQEVKQALEGLDALPPEEVAWALSVSLGRRGLGTVAFETWGDAMVLVWHTPPSVSQHFQDFASRLASRVVGDLYGLPVHGVVLSAEVAVLRVLLASKETAQALHARPAKQISVEATLAALVQGDRT